jgi:nitrite reductase (NADH) large subunit
LAILATLLPCRTVEKKDNKMGQPPSINKANPPQAWICPVCGYIHYGSEPPDECPVCGTYKDMFEPYTEALPEQAASAPEEAGKELKVIIVGAGIAGISAAESVRKTAAQAEIFLISNEIELPYYRLNLTRYLAGEIRADQLDVYPESWYAEQRIRLMRSAEMNAIDLGKKELALKDETRMAFDQLILTVGSHPFLPPFPGARLQNVTTLRTRKDADFILEICQAKGKCVCIGGGLLGLETAGALSRHGVEVTVLENQSWLLPRQLNQTGARLLQAHIGSMGISVRTQARTRELQGDGAVRGVLLEDGATLPADLVVVSAGIRSNAELARQAGLSVNQGIIVDNAMRTSHADVFAAGDAAEHAGVVYGIWAPSQTQGAIAGMNAAGQAAVFTALPRSNTLKVLGYDLFSIGRIAAQDSADQMIDAEIDGKYACFVVRENCLVGSILLGDISLSSKTRKVVEERQDCSVVLNKQAGARDILKFLEDL